MKPLHIMLAVLVAAIWGCNFVFIKLGVHEVPPLFLCAMRFLFASVPAIFFIKKPSAQFKLVILYGLLTFGVQFSLMFSSFTMGMTAGMASLVGQTQIFFSLLFAVLFLEERPTYWQIAGGLIAFSGIVLVGMHIDNEFTLSGLLLVIGAAATWGIGNLISKKLNQEKMMAVIVWGSFIASIPLFFISLFLEGQENISHSFTHLSWITVLSLLYIVYASTWFGYGTWIWLLGRYSITSVVPFTLLIPVFGMFSSILVFGESTETWKIIAALLVITGLMVNFIGPRIVNKIVKKDKGFNLTEGAVNG